LFTLGKRAIALCVVAVLESKYFQFPSTLAAMAKDYLTVQASSVPSERAFSSGTDLVTPIWVGR
jgi:hypothetical protein